MSSSAPGTTTARQPWHHQRHRSSFTFSGQALLATVLTVVLVVVFVIIPFLLYHFLVRGRGGGRLAVGVRRSFSSFGRISSSRRRRHHHHGLDASALASLPVTAYHRDGGANGTADCAVCLSELEDREKVRGLPGCGHVFHVECVDAWLGSRTTCPVCRAEVAQPSEGVEEAPERVGTGGTTLVINVQGGVALARTSALGPGQPAGRAGFMS